MSNYLGRKSDFTPAVYTRYFEHTETPKPSTGHTYFDDDNQEASSSYQIKRDLIFKRLFPSKYANSNNNETETEQIIQNANNTSLNHTPQLLGDFIPLSNNNSSTVKRKQSSPSETDATLSSSDENVEDLLIEGQLPTSTHELIVGHLHSRSTIENIRRTLIRELYERTSDPHTEWLKCKMNIPREYINPKYYADFRRRYKKDQKTNTIKTKKSISIKSKTENGYYVHDLTTTDETTTTIQINDTMENDDSIETLSTKPIRNVSPIILLNDTPNRSKSTPEFIVLDSDEDDNNLNEATTSKFFIDRSATSLSAISHPSSTSNEDYHQEDSKYAQLPSRTTSSSTIIRPILSKKQRRKQNNTKTVSSTPLISAIDRIIDQMDEADSLETSKIAEQQNLLIKQAKKRKKKKKKKGSSLDPLII